MAPGYVARRLDFDNFLAKEVRRRENIRFFEGLAVEKYSRTDDGWLLWGKEGEALVEARMLIVADGAHSTFSRKVAGLKKDPAHHARRPPGDGS